MSFLNFQKSLLTRRQVLDYSTKIAMTSLASQLMPQTAFSLAKGVTYECAKGPAAVESSDVISLLRIDPVTLNYVTGSACCWYCEDRVIVAHHQPVAFVEVMRTAGDSIIASESGDTSKEQSNSNVKERSFQGYHARVYKLTDFMIDYSMGFQGCKLCGIEMAERQAGPKNNDSQGGFFGSTSCVSELTDQLMKEAIGSINDQTLGCWMPELLYDTSLDTTWQYNLCDTLEAAEDGPYCSGISFASLFQDMNDPRCIGEWGAIKPRSFLQVDQDPRRAAAKAAYKAINLAREKDMFPFSDNPIKCKLQMVTPNVNAGYPLGTDPAYDAINCGVSTTGRYGFVWWVPVGCCKERSEVQGFCSPEMCENN